MHLSADRLVYHLLDRWRGNVASLSCDTGRLTVGGAGRASIEFSDLHDAPRITPGWVGPELSVVAGQGARRIRIRSRDRIQTRRIAAEIETGWLRATTARIDGHRDTIEAVLDGLREIEAPTRYPAACMLRPLLAMATGLETDLFATLNPLAVDPDRARQIDLIRTFLADPSEARAAAIVRFEAAQLSAWAGFFDGVEKNPLTPEQRRAIVTDEDATLVLAGAGSGKTSVITAKAGHLIGSGTRPAEEILLLALAIRMRQSANWALRLSRLWKVSARKTSCCT